MAWIATFFLLPRMSNTGFNTTLWASDTSLDGGLKLRLLRLVFIPATPLKTPYIYFGFALWPLFNGTFTYCRFETVWMAKLLGRKYYFRLTCDFFRILSSLLANALYWLYSILFAVASFDHFVTIEKSAFTPQGLLRMRSLFDSTLLIMWIFTYANWKRFRNTIIDVA